MTPFRQLEADSVRRAIHGIGCAVACSACGNSRDLDASGPGRTAILSFAYNRRTGAVLGLVDAPFIGTLFDPALRERATWLLAQSEVLLAWDAPGVRHLLCQALPVVAVRAWISARNMVPWAEEGLRNPELREAIEGLGLEFEPGPDGEAAGLLRLCAHSRANGGEPFLLELLRRGGLAEA